MEAAAGGQEADGDAGGTEIHGQLGVIMARLAQGLSPTTRKHLEQLSYKIAIVHQGPKSYKDKVDVLDDILTGAEVVSPPALREEIRAVLQKALERHTGSPG